MIRRIIGWLLLFLLFIALILKLSGVNELSLYNTGYMSYIRYVSVQFNQWSDFRIPNIPLLENSSLETNWWSAVLDVLIFIANLFIQMFNLSILIINTLIALLSFIVAMVKCIFSAPDIITSGSSTSLIGLYL